MRPHFSAAALLLGLLSFASIADAQITSQSDATNTPIAGAGHDYVHMLNETVSPEIGTVSVQIGVPVPPGRKLNLPFSFQYSSGGALFLGANWSVGWGAEWTSSTAPLVSGGWSYALPQLSRVSKIYSIPQQPPSPDGSTICGTTLGYNFTDANGTQHNLYMAHVYNNYPTQYGGNNYTVNYACQMSGFTQHETDTGGDSVVLSALVNPTSGNGFSPPSDGTLLVADPDGTVYNFGTASWFTPQSSPESFIAPLGSLEDRNGNKLHLSYTQYPNGNPQAGQVSGFTATDTLARPAVVATNFGQGTSNVTVSGLSTSYKATWTNFTYNGYTINDLPEGSTTGCAGSSGQFPGQGGTESVISTLTLPNNQTYQFLYDSTYGTLKQITYPTGGYVKYTWGINSLSTSITTTNSNLFDPCFMYIDTAAVLHRYVSFDGSTTALQQDFSYSTTPNGAEGWSAKRTTVTTTDEIRNTSFNTVYNYVPLGIWGGPNSNSGNSSYLGLERSVLYYDTNGALIQTVTKGWIDQNEMACELHQTGTSGPISGVFYTYGPGGQITDKKEYDYGIITSTSVCPAVGTPTAPANPTRETAITYQSFNKTPTFTTAKTILDRPCQTIIYGFPGLTKTLEAETDNFYDNATITPTPCGAAGTPTVQIVSNLPTGTHDETNYNSTSTQPRGNLTAAVVKCIQSSPACSSGNPQTSYNYDETGQIYSMTDPRTNITNYSYADSYTSCSGNAPPSGSTNAYVTQITYPMTGSMSHIVGFCYGYDDGQLRGSTDQNGQTTIYKYEPTLKRLAETDYPDTGKTTIAYFDATAPPFQSTVTTTKVMNSTQSIVSVQVMDGVGHAIESELTSDPQGYDYTKSTYDGLGRVYTVTNPYRTTSDSTYGTTTYLYDAIGRTTRVTKPDNSAVTTAYCNTPPTTPLTASTLVTDEAGHWRRSQTDALGRLIEVDEPNSTTSSVGACVSSNDTGVEWQTSYAYDALNGLIGVLQGGRQFCQINNVNYSRCFSYNSLKQLVTSNNPESNATGVLTNYTYDANGNLATKIDARTFTTTCAYDALNRLTSRTYSNGDPTVTFTYDQSSCLGGQSPCYNIGRRTTMTDAGGTENFAYDQMGRELTETRAISTLSKTTTYKYNQAGQLLTLAYPTGSGRTITYTYDSAGRPSDAIDTANAINYADGGCPNGAASPTTGVCYSAFGSVSQMQQNGTAITSTYLYNTRLQPCWLYTTTSTALATSTMCTATDSTPGTILDLKYNFNLGAGDNGNVIGITNNRATGRSQGFTYDQVNRILSGQSTATSGQNYCWGESYTYDQWANMYAMTGLSGYTGCSQDTLANVSATANNQLSATGYSYDASGNMLADAVNSYTYNAESEIKSAAGVNYTYDGDGNRLQKTGGKDYWYGAGSEILDETDLHGNFQNEYVFFGGKRIAMRVVSNGTIYYYQEDMLGSTRTMVQAGQTSPCYDSDFLPFGKEIPVTSTCTQNYKFEGKERDTETLNDDFGARYYSWRLGRWLSADWSAVPVPVPYANLTNPQTLNLYAMVSDNPESFADLDGHTVWAILPKTPEIQFVWGCNPDLGPCAADPNSPPLTTTQSNTNAAGAATAATKPQKGTVTILGRSVPYTIAPMDPLQATAALTTLNGAVAAINAAEPQLTQDQIKDIKAVTGIYIVPSMSYAGGEALGVSATNKGTQAAISHDLHIDVKIGTFVISAANVSHASTGFWGSSFVHEGAHIINRDKETAAAEHGAYAAQYRAASAFNLTADETRYLKDQCGASCQ